MLSKANVNASNSQFAICCIQVSSFVREDSRTHDSMNLVT